MQPRILARRWREALLALTLIGLLAAPASASNGPTPVTIGTKGPVSLPVFGDGQSMFRMPSSIAWNLDDQIDLDLFVFRAELSMRNSLNDYDRGYYSFGASGGVVLTPGRPDIDAPDEAWADYSEARKVTVGFGVYPDMAGGSGERDKVRLTTYPETVATQKSILFVTSQLNVAYTPAKWIAFGLGLQVIAAQLELRTLVGGGSTPLEGSPTINGVPIPGNPTYGDFLGLFASDQGSDPSTFFSSDLSTVQFGAIASVSLRPHERFGLGLSYRPRSWAPFDFEGKAKIDATRTFEDALGGLSQPIQDLFLQTLPDQGQFGFVSEYDVRLRGIHVPQQVRLSAAFWPKDWLVLGFEVAWIEWHRAFRATSIKLNDGSNRDLSFVIGSDRIDSTMNTRWRNQWVYSGYLAVGVTDALTLRLGFSYGEIPFNEDLQGVAPSAGFTSTHLSVGGGYRIGPVDLMVLVEHAFHDSKRAGLNTEAVTAQRTRYASKQTFVHFGVSYRF